MVPSTSMSRKVAAVVLLSLVCGTHVSAFTAPATMGFGLRAKAAFNPAMPALRTSARVTRSGPVMKAANEKSHIQKQMAAAIAAVMMSASAASAADAPPAAMVAPPAQPAATAAAPAATAAVEKNTAAPGGVQNWRYSEFIQNVKKNKVEKVTFSADGKKLLAVDVDGNRFKLDALPNDPDLLNTLTVNKVDVTVLPAQQEGGPGDLIRSLIFPAILFGGLFLLSRGSQGGQGGPMGGMGGPMDLSRSGAKVQMQPDTGVTFGDVVGVDGAKIELEEVVQFLKEADRFTELGARIPRGLILEGPPGTGKTLLARAVAGEAGVPFFSISGSEFVEMFVGVGASRVRDLFGQAKKNAPCIIFIDEIDAVGRQRGAGIAGGNDEREQTLNQILTEMDGFEGNPGIIVIAATNRADVLDPALLRPGRFDRRIIVDLPDFKGRVAILGVHCRGKPLGDDVDLEQVSRRCPGFSGASLANLMNEAAIFAARKNKSTISNEEISDALDRVMLGPEKKNAVSSLQKKELVAYHEAGHAVVGALIPDYDQVAKITIMPRGGAGGLTFFAPNEDRVDSGLYTRQFLEGQMAVALGGRIAEEIIYGEDEITTGASNDIQQVTNTAKMMVTRFGMSEKVGQVALAQDQGSPFLGRQMGSRQSTMSSETRALIDSEVSRLVNEAYTKAKLILTENREVLDKLAQLLIDKETVTAEEFSQLLSDSNVKIGSYGLYAQ